MSEDIKQVSIGYGRGHIKTILQVGTPLGFIIIRTRLQDREGHDVVSVVVVPDTSSGPRVSWEGKDGLLVRETQEEYMRREAATLRLKDDADAGGWP